ncbi:MAG: TlpA disulfide reductase family protein [Myxococcota bacterium]
MDRLSAIALALAGSGLLACGDGHRSGGKGATPRSRVNAVQAKAPAAVDLAGFCEAMHEPAAAPPLALPALRKGSPPAPTGNKRWINVWATWCKPCIEELPRLVQWHREIAARSDFDLVFLSADGDAEAVRTFTQAHPEVADTLELEDAAGLDPWVQSLGLAGSAVLPVHIFVGADDRVRCLRSAGIGPSDRAAVERLLVSM